MEILWPRFGRENTLTFWIRWVLVGSRDTVLDLVTVSYKLTVCSLPSADIRLCFGADGDGSSRRGAPSRRPARLAAHPGARSRRPQGTPAAARTVRFVSGICCRTCVILHHVGYQDLKVVCHLPTNSQDIFPRIGSHCFHLWTQPKYCSNLK